MRATGQPICLAVSVCPCVRLAGAHLRALERPIVRTQWSLVRPSVRPPVGRSSVGRPLTESVGEHKSVELGERSGNLNCVFVRELTEASARLRSRLGPYFARSRDQSGWQRVAARASRACRAEIKRRTGQAR